MKSVSYFAKRQRMSDEVQAVSNSTPGSGTLSETRLFADILKQPAQLAASLTHMLGPGNLRWTRPQQFCAEPDLW